MKELGVSSPCRLRVIGKLNRCRSVLACCRIGAQETTQGAWRDFFAETAARVSVSIALILAVLGEMLAGQVGLGQTILLAARSFRSYDMFAGLILLSVLGISANLLLRWLEDKLAGWARRA